MTRARQIRGGIAYAAGIAAEARTRDALAGKGFAILASRCRTPFGEIDLIAATGDLLVFIEVKRRRKLDEAALALAPVQQARLLDAAEYLLQTRPDWQRDNTRFDLVLVDEARQMRWIEDVLRRW